MIVNVLVYLLVGSGLFFTLLGLFVVYQTMAADKRPPMDRSNRINHLRLVWFALKHPHKFAEIRVEDGTLAFPWLTQDEGDNVEGEI